MIVVWNETVTRVILQQLASGNWLGLKAITYIDHNGKERIWEAMGRVGYNMSPRENLFPSAAIVVPLLKRSLHEPCFILVRQFRPPAARYSIEFPAGLVDAGESVEQAGVRELLEETGYRGRVLGTMPACHGNPASSSSVHQFLMVEIDGDLPENQHPKQHLEDTECIEVMQVPCKDLYNKLSELMSDVSNTVDSRLWTFALGIQFWETGLLTSSVRQKHCSDELSSK